MNVASSSSSNAIATGTRPLSMEPNSSLLSLPARPENELWRQKQQEIRELQEASQNLLRLSSNSQHSTANGMNLGGSLLQSSSGGAKLFNAEALSPEFIDDGSLAASGTDLFAGTASGSFFGAPVSNSNDENLVTSSIAPLSLLSTQVADLSLSMPLLPAVSADLDDVSSLRSASTAAGRIGLRQSLSSSPLPVAVSSPEQSRSSLIPTNGRSRAVSSSADLHAENVALRAQVLELRQAAAEKEQELCSHSAASRCAIELKSRLAEADRRIAELTDEVDRLRKIGAMVELLKGDGPVHKVVRGYIENDMATMRAERRIAEQKLNAEVQDWQDRAQQIQRQLQSANEKLRQLAPDGDLQHYLDTLKASAESQQKSLEDERRKAKREFSKKTSELQQRGDECREEVEQAAAKTKDVERTMHARLSEARQEKQRVEGRFKKQVQTLQNELQEAHLGGDEAQEAMALRGNNSELQEECAALSKRCAQETRKNEALQQMVKREGSEARHHMEVELLKEHSRAHDEAWERLSAVEERHSAQIKELQRAHSRELKLVAEQVTERKLDRRTVADPFVCDTELKAECNQKDQDLESLEVSIRDLRSELARAREEADDVSKQHESLLAVLRKEREVADTQFQQLLRNTEEKQKAVGRLHHELAWEDGTDIPSSEHPHSPSSATWSSTALATAAQHVQVSEPGEESPRSLVDSRVLASIGQREGNVDVMLQTMSIERDSQEARRCVEDLRRLLSGAGPTNVSVLSGVSATLNSSEPLTPMEWQSQAHRLLEKLHSTYERVSKQAADENLRIQAGYDREASLKDRASRAEMKMQKKHEQALQQVKSQGLDRLRLSEVEFMQTESALQAAFDGERSELQVAINDTKKELTSEAAEFNSVRKRCDVVLAAEAVAIKCSVDAGEAKVAADMRVEMSELRRNAQAEIADGMQSHRNDMARVEGNIARLEEDHAQYCSKLELNESEERAEVRSELEQLSRVLHRELSATRDEHTAFVRREAKLEARVDGVRHDCNEAESELQEAHLQLERKLEGKARQLEDLELALQSATRRSTTTQNELNCDRIESEAELQQLVHRHAEDREIMAREITQFQDEKLMLEDKIRQNDAAGLAKIQAMQQELDDAEIALQRAEAVSEERLHLLEFQRERRLMRQRGSVSTTGESSPSRPLNRQRSSTSNGESSPPRSSPPPSKRRPSPLMQQTMIQELEAQVETMSEEYEQRFEVQSEEFVQVEKDLKTQLGKLREDKVRERQMKDRQIDKLKSRVAELEKTSEIADRKQSSEAAQHRRQIDEYTQQIDKIRSEKRHLGGSLHEVQADCARINSGNDELRQELGLSEELLQKAHHQCQELVSERHAQEQNALAWKTEKESIIIARDNSMRAVQDLEMQREQSRRQIADFASEAQEACISTERLTQALDTELQQLLPVLPDAEARQLEDVRGPGGVPSEAAIVGTFHALARFVADLARQNAELRCGTERPRRLTNEEVSSHGNPHDKKQVALLQKEIVKLREETQELRLENRHLMSQVSESRHRIAAQAEEDVQGVTSPGGVSRLSGSHAPSVLSESRSLDAQHFRPRQPPQPVSAPSHTDSRLKLKQMHAEKVKAETDLITYKQELSRKTNDMLAENDRLQSLLWDTQQEKQKVEEAGRKKAAHLERKINALEGRLQEKMELEKQLAEEKYCVEEQLNFAAKQLENLLVEEHKDGDLQRDLAGLSRQFEQLHVKHRAQLVKTAEQGQVLEREREKRSQVEEALREASMEIEQEACRHAEQVSTIQEQVTSLWRKVEAKEREVQEAVAEQTAMTCETSALRSKHHQQELSSKELHDEVRRLQEELAQQHELLRDAREKGPGATGALQKLRMKEHELEETRQALQASEARRQHMQDEVRSRAMEIEDLRRVNEHLNEEIRRNRGEALQPEAWPRCTIGQHDPRSNVIVSSADDDVDQRSWDQAYPDSSRLSRRAQDLIDETNEVVVRTVADTKIDKLEASRSMSSSNRGDDGAQNPSGQASLLNALEEIQDTLNSRERELQQHKSGQPEPSRSTGSQGASGFSKALSEMDIPSVGPHASLADVERNFAEAALAHGFHGDQVDRLWAEANARAEALDCLSPSSFPVTQQQQPRSAPIATDVELKGSLEKGAAVRGGGYPESPSASATRKAEAFLHGSTLEDPLASLDVPASSSSSRWPKNAGAETREKQELPASESAASQDVISATTSADRVSKSSPSVGDNSQIGLPANAKEMFRRAEALCERHKFSEAVPCFHQVLNILESGGPDAESVPPVVVAEVWAHLGVAMQSLDRVREAIDSYRKAVNLDESLHVCFANLATLHAYLSEHETATEYITKALRLDPSNPTYVQIRRHLDREDSAGQQSDKSQTKPEEAP